MSKERFIFRPAPHNDGYEFVAHLTGQIVTVPKNMNLGLASETVVIRDSRGKYWTAFETELFNA